MTSDPDWFVPWNGLAAADESWTWGSVTNVLAWAKRDAGYWGHRELVRVACPAKDCGYMVGRVDVPAEVGDPIFVLWFAGGQVTRPMPGRDRHPESHWVGVFPMVREGERAPSRLWFLGDCPKHGPVEVRAGDLWGAVAAKGRRPTKIVG